MKVRLLIKRLIDFAIASATLVGVAPVMAIVAMLVLLRMGSPIIFRQPRPGYNGKPFEVYKFRTMREAVDSNGLPLSDGERLTTLGSFLRRTSLDELPQLWNVIRGDMSLVGPRPLFTEYLERYSPEQMRRHTVRPGITGWAQTNGRQQLSFEERFTLDVWYVDHWSLLLDVKIMVRTLAKVLSGSGIAGGGGADETVWTPGRGGVDQTATRQAEED